MIDDDGSVWSSELPRRKKLYDQGDKTQILTCLWWHFATKTPIPPWLEQAFLNAYNAKLELKIKSWDEVFGRPLKKGLQPTKEHRNKRIRVEIYWRVLELHNCGAGEPIDKGLFEAVGEEFDISGTVASELYYQEKADGGPPTADDIEDFEDTRRLSKIAPVTTIEWPPEG
jgi:hypothetical protein